MTETVGWVYDWGVWKAVCWRVKLSISTRISLKTHWKPRIKSKAGVECGDNAGLRATQDLWSRRHTGHSKWATEKQPTKGGLRKIPYWGSYTQKHTPASSVPGPRPMVKLILVNNSAWVSVESTRSQNIFSYWHYIYFELSHCKRSFYFPLTGFWIVIVD